MVAVLEVKPAVVLVEPVQLSSHEFDVQIYGECDPILTHLVAECGWELPAADEAAPAGANDVDVDGLEFEYRSPNSYHMLGAKVPASAEGAPVPLETQTPLGAPHVIKRQGPKMTPMAPRSEMS